MRHVDSFSMPAWNLNVAAGASVMFSMSKPAVAEGYSPLAQEVVRDVQQFIAQGGPGVSSAASVQGQWLAAQAQRQLQRVEDKHSKSADAAPVATSKATSDAPSLSREQQAFVESIAPWATVTAKKLGVSVRSVMAHAALESGWGQQPLLAANGDDSLNLFGIKAHGGWRGAQTVAMTTEHINGEDVKQRQSFRQYASLGDTFADYAELLARSPRYQAALQTGDDVQAFARGLAAGGYATDPRYAEKLLQVSQKIPVQP